MMLRSLAVAALTLAGSGVACAQSVSIYVSPGATVYVTPSPNGPYYNGNGAPAVYPGPYNGYGPPGPVVATPYPAPVYGPAEVAPQVYVAPAPGYGNGYAPGYGNGYAPTYEAPLSAYGAAPVVVGPRRVWVEEPPRPPAPVPYGRTWRQW